MNHRKFGKKLGRNHHERQALFKSLTREVFIHGAIETTRAKAQSIVSLVEKLANLITTKDTVLAERELSRYIQDKNLVKNIYNQFKAAFVGQTSNFTKMSNIKIRQGDDALIVRYAFVKPFSLNLKKEETPAKETKKNKETKVKAAKK